MINSTMKVREVAIDIPQATRILERLRIDYCCGGDRPLGEACSAAGVEFENVKQLLEQAQEASGAQTASIDFQESSVAELIGHIIDKHHVYTKDEMTRLGNLCAKVIAAHGEHHPELIRIGSLFQALCADLQPHMFKEEQILFPYIMELERSAFDNRATPFSPFGSVNNPVRMMMVEHDTAGEILRELRNLSSDYLVPADACISYKTLYESLQAFEQDLHQHIHLENNILFPRAIALETNG